MNTARNTVAVATDIPLIHYTDERIYSLKDGAAHPRLLKITKRKGKPTGFWYTHDDSWLSTYYEAGRVNGPPGPRKLWRYEFRVPADVYTHDPATVDTRKILTLGRDNLATFIERYHRPEFILSSQNIVGNILEQEAWANKTYSGGTHYGIVMMKTAGMNARGAKAFRQTMKRKAGRAGKPPKENADRILEYYRQYINAETKPSFRNAALGDIMDYDWVRFWDSVSANLGGVEFAPDVADITTITLSGGETIDMSWLRFLEIGSGVIFRPLTYFGGAMPVEAEITYTVASRRNNASRRNGVASRRTNAAMSAGNA